MQLQTYVEELLDRSSSAQSDVEMRRIACAVAADVHRGEGDASSGLKDISRRLAEWAAFCRTAGAAERARRLDIARDALARSLHPVGVLGRRATA